MTKGLWVNLPVKDISAALKFYAAIGFGMNERRTNDHMGAMYVGTDKIPVMLFKETTFKGVVQNNVSNAHEVTEVIFSFDASTREEIDQMAEKVKAAGGNLFAPPAEIQGWMYGCAFADIDGHRWNMLYMDNDKMPK